MSTPLPHRLSKSRSGSTGHFNPHRGRMNTDAAYRRLALTILGLDVATLAGELSEEEVIRPTRLVA